jgi:hypothetical protein
MIRENLKSAILAAMDTAAAETENPQAAREAWAEAVANGIADAVEAAISGTTVNTTALVAGPYPVVGVAVLEPNVT